MRPDERKRLPQRRYAGKDAIGMRNRARDMQRHRAGWLEPLRARAIEIHRIKRHRRAAWIGQVEYDQIELFGHAAHVRKAVFDTQIDARVVEASPMDVAEMLARDIDDRRIDLRERHRLHRRMLEQLFGTAAVASADDQRASRVRMRQRSHVNEVLVIEELVLFGRHEMAVETKQLAEGLAVVDFDVLERRA